MCGVPQGVSSRNLACDAVLWVEFSPGVLLVCYADDALVPAGREVSERTISLVEFRVFRDMEKVEKLSLRIAPQKTETLWP